jgi:hypothetical protein
MKAIKIICGDYYFKVMFLAVVVLAFLFFGCHSHAHAQTLSVTNGDKVLTVSNGSVIATTPLAVPAAPLPPLVNSSGVVVPAALLDYISQQTGLPMEILQNIQVKYLVWFGILLTLYNSSQTVARDLRKILPDSWQTGKFGLVLKHVAREINPQLTPTPPDVAVKTVELKDVQTGAQVAPQAVNLPTKT